MEEQPVDWRFALPIETRCESVGCHKEIIRGFKYNARCSYCPECAEKQGIKGLCIEFSNAPAVIDSRYIASVDAFGQQFGQQFTLGRFKVLVSLQPTVARVSFLGKRNSHYRNSLFKLELYLDNVQFHTLRLLNPEVRYVPKEGEFPYITGETRRHTETVPFILPGDEIILKPGVTVKVHSSYVDPRVAIEKKEDEAWEPFFKAMQENPPLNVTEFRKRTLRCMTELGDQIIAEQKNLFS